MLVAQHGHSSYLKSTRLYPHIVQECLVAACVVGERRPQIIGTARATHTHTCTHTEPGYLSYSQCPAACKVCSSWGLVCRSTIFARLLALKCAWEASRKLLPSQRAVQEKQSLKSTWHCWLKRRLCDASMDAGTPSESVWHLDINARGGFYSRCWCPARPGHSDIVFM